MSFCVGNDFDMLNSFLSYGLRTQMSHIPFMPPILPVSTPATQAMFLAASLLVPYACSRSTMTQRVFILDYSGILNYQCE